MNRLTRATTTAGVALALALSGGGIAQAAPAAPTTAAVAVTAQQAAVPYLSLSELRVDTARAPGLFPMYCKTIKYPPRDPWYLCMNIGTGTTVAARCKPTYKVVCGF